MCMCICVCKCICVKGKEEEKKRKGEEERRTKLEDDDGDELAGEPWRRTDIRKMDREECVIDVRRVDEEERALLISKYDFFFCEVKLGVILDSHKLMDESKKITTS